MTAGDDRTARIFETTTGAELLTLRGHKVEVTAAAFSRDGTRIVTASKDATALIRDSRPAVPMPETGRASKPPP